MDTKTTAAYKTIIGTAGVDMDTKDKLIADLIAALVTAKVDLKSKAPDAPYRHKKTAAIVAHALDKAYAAGYGPAS